MQLKPRRLGVVLMTLILATVLLGCPLLTKKQGEGDPSVADAATTTVTGTGAKNEADVLRYPAETPLNNVPAVIGKDGATARTFPGSGSPVAVLPKGTPCAKVAQFYSTGTLIMFNDPVGDGSTLLDWMTVTSFDTGPVPTTVKTVFVPPKVVDAGATAVKDSGTAPTPVADAGAPKVVDAGSSPVPACAAALPACPATADGRCATGRTNDNGMCRLPCKADTDCPRNTKCGKKKLCTAG